MRTSRCFLEGRSYEVLTYHHTLKYLRTPDKPTPGLVRWLNGLELYDPKISYKPCMENDVPDALSRETAAEEPVQDELEPQFLYTTMAALPDEHKHDWPKYYVNPTPDLPQVVTYSLKEEKDHFVIRERKVYRKIKVKDTEGTEVVKEVRFLPFSERADKVKEFHEGFGHAGKSTIFDLMRFRYRWPTMRTDIKNWLQCCPPCQMNSRRQWAHHDEMHPLDAPLAFARWYLDFIGELPKSTRGSHWILVAVDYMTNYSVARAVPVAFGQAVADFLYEEMVMRFGCPQEILTDRGANFMNKVLRHYTQRIKTNHKFTSAFHPRTNSKCERLNGTLK